MNFEILETNNYLELSQIPHSKIPWLFPNFQTKFHGFPWNFNNILKSFLFSDLETVKYFKKSIYVK